MISQNDKFYHYHLPKNGIVEIFYFRVFSPTNHFVVFFSKMFSCASGKSPFFTGLDETGGALLDDGSHGGLGMGMGQHTGMVGEAGGPQGMPNSAQPLSSPSRSSPHSQGSETGERFSRKVFVGGLPPDIDEGMIYLHATPPDVSKL